MLYWFESIGQTQSWPTKKLWRSRDYLAFTLQSAITECIHKTMAIDRKAAWITMIAAGSRQDRGRIARIAAGSRGSRQDREDRSRAFWDEMKWECNFFLYLGCLWSDLQMVFTKMMRIHSWVQSLCQIRLKHIFYFLHVKNHCLSPGFLKPIYPF